MKRYIYNFLSYGRGDIKVSLLAFHLRFHRAMILFNLRQKKFLALTMIGLNWIYFIAPFWEN